MGDVAGRNQRKPRKFELLGRISLGPLRTPSDHSELSEGQSTLGQQNGQKSVSQQMQILTVKAQYIAMEGSESKVLAIKVAGLNSIH